MERLSEGELAYLGGFFDGEGSVGIYTRGRYFPVMSVQVVQNSSPSVDAAYARWVSVLGGNIARNRSTSGRVKLQWQANGTTASRIIRTLLPYVVFKREQMELCLLWEELKPGVRRGVDGRLLPSVITPELQRIMDRVRYLKRETVEM